LADIVGAGGGCVVDGLNGGGCDVALLLFAGWVDVCFILVDRVLCSVAFGLTLDGIETSPSGSCSLCCWLSICVAD
jgi:hypothetical protein